MKKEKLIIIVVPIVILSVFFLIMFFVGNKETSGSGYYTITSSGEVTIDLAPAEIKDNKLYVNIGVNTHTVSLESYDLKELTTLYYDGRSIKPESAPVLEGHHTSGVLVFDVEENIANFKIIIVDIPDVNERIFDWSK